MDATDTSDRAAAPPYIAYPTWKGMIGALRKSGVPQRVDESIVRAAAAGPFAQVAGALRFLGLTDRDSRPTLLLRRLVEAYGTESWRYELAAMLRLAYAPLFEL